MHDKGTITIPNNRTAAVSYNANKKVISNSYAPFINCISQINNAEVNDVNDIDALMSMLRLLTL